ncbi:MAG: DUF1415 family protein [Lewinellaceae bacterium]|nr:DUF1415 family protein [Lewinellaceae bacterium]
MKPESIERTKSWVEKFVIGENICPFARYPYERDQIKFVTTGGDFQQIATNVWKEILYLQSVPKSLVSNTLCVIESPFSWGELLDLCFVLEEMLEIEMMSEQVQIVGFHPEFTYADSDPNDHENYTNRSPLPMIHILRSEELEAAIKSHGNTLEITENNAAKLRAMTKEKIMKFFE